MQAAFIAALLIFAVAANAQNCCQEANDFSGDAQNFVNFVCGAIEGYQGGSPGQCVPDFYQMLNDVNQAVSDLSNGISNGNSGDVQNALSEALNAFNELSNVLQACNVEEFINDVAQLTGLLSNWIGDVDEAIKLIENASTVVSGLQSFISGYESGNYCSMGQGVGDIINVLA
eukprot:TRINITY_DN5469_c0_g1_i1.p1 TRINITY_DN5469_c0_g1~~TRINITY_DN5469_c0_g1_i1.p1  ORF type:complete len:173 (+),score=38.67 TRINITY_DN5469_c0_g1_i1:2-520(+)